MSKYSEDLQKLYYCCDNGFYHITNNYKRIINQLPIELQEDIIDKHPKYIKTIHHHTFNMWQSLLTKNLKYFNYNFDKNKCKKYNCYNEVNELYKFLTI
jgi:hypothetical protein